MNSGERVIYEFSGFRLDPELRILLHNGDPVTVWPKVFDTLVVLLESRGRIVEKEELMQALWPQSFVEESNLTQNIFVLRKILGDDRNGHSFIQTVPRRGYKFIAQVREAGLAALENDLPASYWRERSPFRGLQVFETEDAWLFFGREPETDELLTRLRRAPVLSVVGNSGSGKSSLLRAGLVPALQQGRFCPDGSPNQQWRIAVFRPSVAPFDYLAEVLPGQLAPELGLQERAEFIRDFRNRLSGGGESLRDAIAVLAGAISHEAGPTRILLLVDQFEEIFTLTNDRRTRDSYIDALLAAARLDGAVPVHVVLAVRADFYPECMEHAALSRCMAANQYNVGRMSHEQLRESIEKRLQLASSHAEAGLIDSLLEDAGAEPGNLALLEHALGQLWDKCGGFACTLTNSAYAEIGRLRGALGRHADEVYAGLRDENQKQLAKKIFLELVHVGDGAQDARRRVAKADLVSLGKAAEIDLLLTHLASSRLISTGEEDHESFVEVSHEALIREWPLLREWLTQNRDDLRLERRLLQSAEEWKSLNRDKGALLQGARLAQAEEWLSRHPDVPVLLQDFVQTSICAREEARERKLAQQKAAAIRLRWFSAALAVMLLLAIGAAWFIYRQKIIEKSRAMAAQSGEMLQRDHGQALDLAIRSWETAHTEEARLAVTRSFPETLATLQHEGHVSTATFSHDGRRVVTASLDHTARVWDGYDGHLLFILRGHTAGVNYADFSPDGRQVVTGSDDHTARVWSAEDGHLAATLRGHTERIIRAEFFPDGRRVLTMSADSTARVWDASNGRLLLTLQHKMPVERAEFSPDGKRIATASWDKTARVWDSADGRLLRTLQYSDEVVRARFSPDNRILAIGTSNGMVQLWNNADDRLMATLQNDGYPSSIVFSHDSKRIVVAILGQTEPRVWSTEDGRLLLTLHHKNQVSYSQFSPDDSRIVTSGLDHLVHIWDSTDGRLLATLEGHTGPVWSAEFCSDGQRIVTASADQTARIWNIVGALTVATLRAATGYLYLAAYSHDGQHIVTAGMGNMAQLWKAADGRLSHTLKGHTDQITTAVFSPDDRLLLTASFDKTARIWNVEDGRLVTVLQGHSDWIWNAQFSPDGQWIATAGYDKIARVWNAADGKLLATLSGHTKAITGLQFSPDGRRIVTASHDKTARIWNAADGALLTVLQTNTDRILNAQFSPDGQRIVTSGYMNTAHVWNAADGRLLATLSGHTQAVNTAQFSPDGQRIVTASDDHTACLWNSDGHLLATLRGHTDKLWKAFFSPDGQYVVTASGDNTARVWNASDGRLIVILQGHKAAVYSAQFSPDGKQIVTASMDATARIWKIFTPDDAGRILGH